MKRLIFSGATMLLMASSAAAQQFPMVDMVADRVVQKYQNSSCADLMVQRDQPRSQEEKNAIQALRGDPQMRREFINRVAAPVANKLFECHMLP
jgi:hypothetical protein